MNPRKALHELAENAVLARVFLPNFKSRPGEDISKQSEEIREQLRELQSKDAADVADHVIKLMVIK